MSVLGKSAENIRRIHTRVRGSVKECIYIVLVPLQKLGVVSYHIALPNPRYYLQTFRFVKRKVPEENDSRTTLPYLALHLAISHIELALDCLMSYLRKGY